MLCPSADLFPEYSVLAMSSFERAETRDFDFMSDEEHNKLLELRSEPASSTVSQRERSPIRIRSVIVVPGDLDGGHEAGAVPTARSSQDDSGRRRRRTRRRKRGRAAGDDDRTDDCGDSRRDAREYEQHHVARQRPESVAEDARAVLSCTASRIVAVQGLFDLRNKAYYHGRTAADADAEEHYAKVLFALERHRSDAMGRLMRASSN